MLDRPVDANGKVLSGKFRTGDYRYDSKPREIKQVLTYSGNVLYRYIIKGIKYVSYTGDELLRASVNLIL